MILQKKRFELLLKNYNKKNKLSSLWSTKLFKEVDWNPIYW